MTDARWVGLLVILALSIYDVVLAARKGGWSRVKYSLKRSADSLRFLVYVIVSVYLLIGALWLVPVITDKAGAAVSTAHSDLVRILLGFMPSAYVWFLIAGIVWLAFKIMRPFKYNDQEKQWTKESEERLRQHLPVWARKFVKGGNKHDAV